LVAPPPVKRQVAQAGGLGAADAVLHAGALPVAQFKDRQVGVGLVGDEHLEAVAVKVGEAQLRAGVGPLTAAQQAGGGRPVAQLDPAGQRAHPGAVAGLPVGLDRRRPGRLGDASTRIRITGVENATASSVYVRWVRVRYLPRDIYVTNPSDSVRVHGDGVVPWTGTDGRTWPQDQLTVVTWRVERSVRVNGSGDSLVLYKDLYAGATQFVCLMQAAAVVVHFV
jgi:hypothetical protein